MTHRSWAPWFEQRRKKLKPLTSPYGRSALSQTMQNALQQQAGFQGSFLNQAHTPPYYARLLERIW